MKLKNSMEQAICLLIMIAHSDEKTPLKSYNISKSLGVSDSYLKKIIRQLVVAGLITSEAGKKGGVSLKKNPDKITLLDIFEAIEGKEPFARATGLVERVFSNELKEVKEQKQAMILEAFNQAEKSYKEKLKKITLQMAMVDRNKKTY
ncbi:Rrf2 family transcriptional regulator [Thomasclavelia spiroformis]|uniref:Rrf2 family transcriptional regulator n=1 Tax=Thomasclavelia spiroformis TaxID=29348 RepID=UPI000B3762BE|nr:Rrf2 family transcriptional regulator [Thomasclavelia spiroformis]OUQ01640.1 Rrf2 family transcriptional regulator [Thomasclavelia spiroformis]